MALDPGGSAVIPVVTSAEMAAIDAEAPEPVATLIGRAGTATASEALRLLGGAYGKRVLVIAGKGNNGNDGRVAGRRLVSRGARVAFMAPTERPPDGLRPDLVIDAAFGTGLRDGWTPPAVGDAPVLAVDLPSGVNGLTGQIMGQHDQEPDGRQGPASPDGRGGPSGPGGQGGQGDEPNGSEGRDEAGSRGGVLRAAATVTFAALKPGLLLGAGRWASGDITLADIGLDCGRARIGLVTTGDLTRWLAPRPVDSHKWKAACWVVAGSPTMPGASHLCVAAAQRAGAGYVRLSSPGLAQSPGAPTEAVYHPLAASGWAETVIAEARRFSSLVIGPGLGRSEPGDIEIRRLVAAWDGPLVVDGDGLSALGERAGTILASRRTPAVLTPHDGEFERLAGHRPGPDRIDEARRLAVATGSVVLLKGPTTVVADAAGRVGLSLAGDARLATAGTGDVLAGIIGALLAQGMAPWPAALAGAELHGRAAARGPRRGLVAGDLLRGLIEVLNDGPLAGAEQGDGSPAGSGLALRLRSVKGPATPLPLPLLSPWEPAS